MDWGRVGAARLMKSGARFLGLGATSQPPNPMTNLAHNLARWGSRRPLWSLYEVHAQYNSQENSKQVRGSSSTASLQLLGSAAGSSVCFRLSRAPQAHSGPNARDKHCPYQPKQISPTLPRSCPRCRSSSSPRFEYSGPWGTLRLNPAMDAPLRCRSCPVRPINSRPRFRACACPQYLPLGPTAAPPA